MEKYDVVFNTKGVRKVAFAAGFGFFMGKAVATAIDTFVWKAVANICEHNEDAVVNDNIDVSGIKHQNQEDSSTDKDEKIKMGFHM